MLGYTLPGLLRRLTPQWPTLVTNSMMTMPLVVTFPPPCPTLPFTSLLPPGKTWSVDCLQASFVSALVSGRSAEAGGRLGHCRKSGFWLQVLTLANKQKRK